MLVRSSPPFFLFSVGAGKPSISCVVGWDSHYGGSSGRQELVMYEVVADDTAALALVFHTFLLCGAHVVCG